MHLFCHFSAPGKFPQSNPMDSYNSCGASVSLQDKTARQQFQDKFKSEVRKITIMQIVY